MERLTRRTECGDAYYPECFDHCMGEGASEKCNDCEYDKKICDTLADYEDTGLTPPEIMELKERDTAKEAIYEIYGDQGDGKDPDAWICPNCEAVYDIDDDYDFCPDCGQMILR